MKPETSGFDLLAAAEQTLVREVAPGLGGETRFKVLMAASALRMVMRELAVAQDAADLSGRLAAFGATPDLVEAVRAGRHDADQDLHAALTAEARLRTEVSNPVRAGVLARPDGQG